MCKAGEKKGRTAVFAGTAEGRRIAGFVLERGYSDTVDFLVATEYGQELLEEEGSLNVFAGRLDMKEMEDFFARRNIRLVIDATHPYACQVSGNIRGACGEEREYVRVERSSDLTEAMKRNIIEVSCMAEAAKTVEELGERALITTGAKEIGAFSSMKDTESMIVARVLPSPESIKACLDAEVSPSNIIGMQGPFTLEMNLATLNQFGCKVLVTKDTGKPGGFMEKARCADYGYKVIVVARQEQDEGITVEEAEERIAEENG